MADSIVPSQGNTTIAPELQISIQAGDGFTFCGTRAQLEAEGLPLPNGDWPKGNASIDFEANGLSYHLSRFRPDGHKGPMRSWLDSDNWRVCVREEGWNVHIGRKRQLDRQAAELRAAYQRETLEGRRLTDARWERFWAAHHDKKFQAFKAAIPGLIPPKRGRKAKPAE